MNLVIGALTTNYANFSGRARRMEFWLFLLAMYIMEIVAFGLDYGLGFFDGESGFPVVIVIFVLAIIIPSIAVAVRRLHDTDRSGWWYFIVLVPLVGAIAFLVFMCLPGTPGPNRFGADPLQS